MPTPDGTEAPGLPPELKNRALEALKAPEFYESPLPSGFVTVARLWHYEADGAWRAWSVSSRPSAIDAPALRIRKVVWDRPAEFARLADPVVADRFSPRLTLSEARFPPESWDALIQEANTLRVQPLFPEVGNPLGEGKERFGLAYRLSLQTVSFEWWDLPPAEWKDLAEWTARLRDALDAWLKR
jgi:hypothetical protein